MLPITALYDNVTPPSPPPSIFSVLVRVGADAKESRNKKLNICKHNVINKTHFTCKITGDRIITAPKLDPDLPTVDHIINDILIDVSKAPRQEGGLHFI